MLYIRVWLDCQCFDSIPVDRYNLQYCWNSWERWKTPGNLNSIPNHNILLLCKLRKFYHLLPLLLIDKTNTQLTTKQPILHQVSFILFWANLNMSPRLDDFNQPRVRRTPLDINLVFNSIDKVSTKDDYNLPCWCHWAKQLACLVHPSKGTEMCTSFAPCCLPAWCVADGVELPLPSLLI